MKKGFTLIELLAVIVVLAIILIIAVPTILNIITNSKKGAFESDAKLVLNAIENQKLVNESFNVMTIDKDSVSSILGLSNDNYEDVEVSLNEQNKPYVVIVGKNKWEGLTAVGTFNDMTVVNSNEYDTTPPTIDFDTNGSSTYIKSKSIKITVNDPHIDNNSLEYQWTTDTIEPAEGSFNTTFVNGNSINTPNVTGGYYLWVLAKDTSNNTTIIRSGLFNLDNIAPTITMLGSSPITINVGDTYTDAGATASDNIDGDITSNIIKTSTVSTSIGGTYTVTYTVSDTAGNSATEVVRTVIVNATDISGPNYITDKGVNGPVLATGMTPIKWDGTTWVDTTVYDPAWYNYDTTSKQWANARTADGSMWVWIPRYIYKITSGWHSNTTGAISIQFTQGTNDNWNSAVIGNINTDTTANASNNTWTNHPGFKFGSTELTGIWVAKFEAAEVESMSSNYSGCYSGDNVSTKTVKILPNVPAWVCINNSNAFLTARNMETKSRYGWTTASGLQANGDFSTDTNNINTHLMKNLEWGAVAYLSKSVYGKNTVEVFINNARTLQTGCASTSAGSSGSVSCNYTYNTTNGQKASTTGTIYGVYDMSGGVNESAAAYLNNGNAVLTSNSSSLLSADAKYKDVYTVAGTDSSANNFALAVNFKGDAIYETSVSSTAWFSDYAIFSYVGYPSFFRGGMCDDTTGAGLFKYKETPANSGIGSNGFRPVLLVGSGL